MAELTQERLKELLWYVPEVGTFIWLVDRSNKVKARTIAGTVSSGGYRSIKIDGKQYQAQNLAWLYMTGEWPAGLVDHKDNDCGDNRWENLRLATHQQNMFNRTLNKNNKTGIKGVSYVAKYDHYTVRISNVYYGCYRTLEEAAERAANMREQLHGRFANHG